MNQRASIILKTTCLCNSDEGKAFLATEDFLTSMSSHDENSDN